ncbi:MAG: polyamine aminopropyltransferase [Firmicutes bacterium]|nr:polyamine aminopropyltransferase [Bacillota bacterium]
MDLWFTEKHPSGVGLTCRVTKTLHTERSAYQDIAVLQTQGLGRMLVLDGLVQTTEADEFFYHEMIAHVPLFSHPCPRHVLVIGGGDGGTVREVLKHPSVQRVDLVEIDSRVIELCRQYMPSLSTGLNDPRAVVTVGDGIEYVRTTTRKYDVILVDSTDPIGPAVVLFTPDFYRAAASILNPDGILVAQSDSPISNPESTSRTYAFIGESFPIVNLYLAPVPTYPGAVWSFTMGSKKHLLLPDAVSGRPPLETRYYTPEVHRAAFALPRFVIDLLRGGCSNVRS